VKFLRRLYVAIAIATGSVLVFAGCAGHEPQATGHHTATRDSVSARAQAPAQPSPAAPPPRITGEQLSGTVQALDTVFTACDQGTASISKPVQVFDTKTGRLVNAPVPPPIPAGAELVAAGNLSFGCTLTGTADSPKIFYVWNYRSPSKGLEPASTHLMAGVASIHDPAMTQVVELPADLGGPPSKVIPTDGGPVLWWCCRGRDAVTTAALDPDSLNIRWTAQANMASHDRSSVAFYDVFENRFTVKDVASGAESVVEQVHPSTTSGVNTYELERGYLLDQVGSDNVGYFSTVTNKFAPDILTDDRVTQASVNEGKLLVVGKDTLKVVDVVTSAVLFTLSAPEKSAVDSYRFASSGDYLYIANASDSPVIDIRNRQQASSGWKVRPQTFLGKSWVLVDHRPNATQDCYESTSVFECGGSMSNPADLALEPVTDGIYPGPWF
jgi:hypothetical protein